jgi:hypothetical protein
MPAGVRPRPHRTRAGVLRRRQDHRRLAVHQPPNRRLFAFEKLFDQIFAPDTPNVAFTSMERNRRPFVPRLRDDPRLCPPRGRPALITPKENTSIASIAARASVNARTRRRTPPPSSPLWRRACFLHLSGAYRTEPRAGEPLRAAKRSAIPRQSGTPADDREVGRCSLAHASRPVNHRPESEDWWRSRRARVAWRTNSAGPTET